eukprot:jgi/Mesvir1/16260/Mv08506-RA.2
MSLRFTSDYFPRNGSIKDQTALPWGCVVKPFAPLSKIPLESPNLVDASVLARCEECFGYINWCCQVERHVWRCALCDTYNSFTYPREGREKGRYSRSAARGSLPELSMDVYEFQVARQDSSTIGEDVNVHPVYIAAVDLSAGEEFLDLVKSSLVAALEGMGPGSLFGLITYAERVGMYDFMGALPVVKHVLIGRDGELASDLAHVMPLDSLLAPVDEYKDHITAALETLRPATSWERAMGVPVPGTSAGGGNASGGGATTPGGLPLAARGFGSAVAAILRYLEERGPFVSARLFAFLSGPPNHGLGVVDVNRGSAAREGAGQGAGATGQHAQAPKGADRLLLAPDQPFYEELAAQAVEAGVCVDLFVVSSDFVDLASLKALASRSGGALYLYAGPEDSTLPQDIYRMLSRPHARGGILRVRTSTEFKVARAYGHFFPDPEYENVHHIISCDPFDTYAFDFEFANAGGFGSNEECPPVVQVAFQYTILLPVHDEGEPHSEPNGEPAVDADGRIASSGTHKRSGPVRFELHRRLRVHTAQREVAKLPKQVYDSVKVEVIICLLVHKIISACVEEGVEEGRLLLQDWLVILLSHYNEMFVTGEAGKGAPELDYSAVDVQLSKCPEMTPLPRLVFALLRSPILRSEQDAISRHPLPDLQVYLQNLYRCDHVTIHALLGGAGGGAMPARFFLESHFVGLCAPRVHHSACRRTCAHVRCVELIPTHTGTGMSLLKAFVPCS